MVAKTSYSLHPKIGSDIAISYKVDGPISLPWSMAPIINNYAALAAGDKHFNRTAH